MVISAAVLVQGAFSYGSLNLGFSVSTFWYGAARVVFGFTLGVLIYPLRHRVVVPGSILPVVGGLSVVAMLMSFLISGPVVQLACDQSGCDLGCRRGCGGGVFACGAARV